MQRRTLRSSKHDSACQVPYLAALQVTPMHNIVSRLALYKPIVNIGLWQTNNGRSSLHFGKYNLCCIITMQQPSNHSRVYLLGQLSSLFKESMLKEYSWDLFPQ